MNCVVVNNFSWNCGLWGWGLVFGGSNSGGDFCSWYDLLNSWYWKDNIKIKDNIVRKIVNNKIVCMIMLSMKDYNYNNKIKK